MLELGITKGDDKPIDLVAELEAMQAAIERRDMEEAAERGVSLEALHAMREAATRRDVDRELREMREERLGADRRRITSDDLDRILSTSPDALGATKSWHVVERFLRSRRAFCVLSGPRGIGKTVAALAAKSRLGGLVIGADDMTRAVRNEHEAARELRTRVFEVAFLVVDDLGLEVDADAGVRAFQAVIDQRQGAGMRTLITTNLRRVQMESHYDRRTIERIVHGGVFVELDGKSLRRTA